MAERNDPLLKGAYAVLNSVSKIQQEKTKLKTELLKEQIKRNQNFMYKLAEKQATDEMARNTPEQLALKERYQAGPQIPGYVGGVTEMPGHSGNINGMPYMNMPEKAFDQPGDVTSAPYQKDVFDLPTVPQRDVIMDQKGMYKESGTTRNVKEEIFRRIQVKKERGVPLTSTEKKFEQDYSKGVTTSMRTPTWQQEQKAESVKAALKLKRGFRKGYVGQTEMYDLKTPQDAYDFVVSQGFNPNLFQEELSNFEQSKSKVV